MGPYNTVDFFQLGTPVQHYNNNTNLWYRVHDDAIFSLCMSHQMADVHTFCKMPHMWKWFRNMIVFVISLVIQENRQNVKNSS